MNLFKKILSALLFGGLIMSCGDDDTPNPKGISETIFSSFTATADGDGTTVTVNTVSIGATSFSVDFGDPNSTSDVLTISEQGGSISYDYPNEAEEVTYTITVTSKGVGADIVRTQDIVVTHIITAIDSAPASPAGRRYNVFGIFTDGMDVGGVLQGYPIGVEVTATPVLLESGNSILQYSRLGSDAGLLKFGSGVVVADAFAAGVGATNIHFDVHSNFATGIDKLKITLYNANVAAYVIDGIDLTDGDWASLDYDLATAFTAPVAQIDSIGFELGAGGTSSSHATINVDNIYLSKSPSSTILNGDFTLKQEFWKWGVFTDGETNPFGSSSDGSDLNYDGTDNGGKTAGAKWSSSQSGGEFKSAASRYAYQELALTPNADYVLEYQYAIKNDSGNDPAGGRNLVGLILDGQYTDGADAVSNIGSNLGLHQGLVAEGKFSDTDGDVGTTVQIPFTANASGEIAVMFYAVTPKDAYIDNVKVVVPGDILPTTPMFSSSTPGGDDYKQFSFTNTSTTATSFSWDFGDGNTSTEKSPTHTYAIDGVYNVVLTTTNIAGSNTANESLTAKAPAIPATFKAIVLNGTCDDWTTNTGDNADSWNMKPNSTIEDNTGTIVTSPYTWSNSDLDDWLLANCGDKDQQPGSTSDGNKFPQMGDRGVKINEACRRLYQAVTVEVGVEYTFTIDSRSEASGVPSEVFILNTAIANEIGLGASAASVDKYFAISNDFNSSKSSTTADTFTTSTFTFIPTTTEIIIYVRASLAVDSSNEVFYDNIGIATPGFN